MSAISIITSLGLGALHALEPGHGKTFLASYSLSNNIDKKASIKIISSMAISHSLLLIILGLIVPIIIPRLEESIHFYIQILASLLVLFIGLRMLLKLNNKDKNNHDCSCGIKHTQEEHNNSLLLIKKKEIVTNKTFTLNVPTKLDLTDSKTSKKYTNPILVGIVNGIMPCPSALAVMGIAFTYSSAWVVSTIMFTYVLGFILAMFSLLIIIVTLKKKFLNTNSENIKYQKKIELFSSIIIILSGVYYLFLAFNHTH